MTTAGIVLAAGQSKRFGDQNKLLVDFQGEPLARHAARAMAAAGFEHLIAVVSDQEVEILFDKFEIAHSQRGSQQSTSLRVGIRRAVSLNAQRIVIALADMPCIEPTTLKTIDNLCASEGLSGCTDGTTVSPPAGFSREYFAALSGIRGDFGARSMLRSIPQRSMLKCPHEQLLDVDTIADLSACPD